MDAQGKPVKAQCKPVNTQGQFADAQCKLADAQGQFADAQCKLADAQGQFADAQGQSVETQGKVMSYTGIKTIWLILGKDCNCHCRYCSQRSSNDSSQYNSKDASQRNTPSNTLCAPSNTPSNPLCNQEVNYDVFEFITNVIHNSNGDIPEENPVRLIFYGGEPLLYWYHIFNVVTTFKDKLRYTIITNGKALTDDKVKFINDHNIKVQISWDGPRSNEVRGYDVLVNKRNELLALNNLAVHSIISNFCYPEELVEAFYEFEKEYRKAHDDDYPELSIAPIRKYDIDDPDVYNVNIKRIEAEMASLVRGLLRDDPVDTTHDTVDPVDHVDRCLGFNDLVIDLIKRYLSFTNGLDRGESWEAYACSTGKYAIRVDLQGNLYKCHNEDNPVSTIYSSKDDYLKAYHDVEPTFALCKTCTAAYKCRGLCNNCGDAYFLCKLNKALYETVIQFILGLSSVRGQS